MKRSRSVIVLVALFVALLPREARAQETVCDAAAPGLADANGPSDERDDEPGDESPGVLSDVPAPLGEPIELSRRYSYLYLFKRTDALWGSQRVWCICETPYTKQMRYYHDELRSTTEEEYGDCLAFGVLVGQLAAGTAAFVASSATSPAGLAAMAATGEAREYLLIQAAAVGGYVGNVIAARLCPKPTPQERPSYHCPTCPGCPGGHCPCPCPCPPPCPDGPPCPVCPPGCPEIPGPGGGVCRSEETGDEP